MHSQHHIPIQEPSPDGRQLKRHHTASYYVDRVKGSLTTRVSKFVCAIFLGILLFMGVLIFILWLSLRPHRPRFYVHEFSIPGLAQENGFANAQVIFNVTVRNPNHKIGIYYDSMQVTLFYEDQNIGGNSLLFPFYQDSKNTTILYDVLGGASLTVNNDRWTKFTADLAKGTVIFRLELKSSIRFKIYTWRSKHHKMHAKCEVGVGPDGLILARYKDKRCPVYFS
ncbi:NDR1/HIN1-like protein 26 [Cornus florida]|uniref:NDR1/HIN1-like protein 26 n=1 Tax=Cornus florida TaxID=4283 RepID=UPI0028A16900|nr:NDR1/HIN1-like protein 26 [Cornus florida]